MFTGEVVAISPINDSAATSVSYPVTVHLSETGLAGLLPGMNAVATLVDQTPLPDNSWLVPTNALRQTAGATTVMVVRGANPQPVSVTTGDVQVEWTVVQSDELQADDQVVGSVTSNLDSNTFPGGSFPGGGGPAAGGFGGGNWP